MTAIERRIEGMSLDEYDQRFEQDGPFEIIDGEVIEVGINKGLHAFIITILYSALSGYVLSKALGIVFSEAPFVLSDNPQWVKGSRLPDVMFYQAGCFDAYRANTPDWGDKPYNLIPDLVVEVLSPSDRAGQVARKIAAYIGDGIPLIWVIDPKKRRIFVYQSEAVPSMTLTVGDSLEGGAVIPGFTLPLTALFTSDAKPITL